MAIRRVASSDDFFDLMDQMGDGKFITIGYVTGANLDVPKVKRKNPETNRMKGYDDYTVFKSDEEIGGIVRITSYNIQYRNRDKLSKLYQDYKARKMAIDQQYGIYSEPTERTGYKEANKWGNGIDMYKGENEKLNGHSYNAQNTYSARKKSINYIINKEGHIIRALDDAEVKPFLAKRESFSSERKKLQKLGADDTKIANYISDINALKMSYRNFESNSILYIAATVNGEKLVYINDRLSRAVNDININPSDFIAIAKERYSQDIQELQEMTKRHAVLSNILSEKRLNRIIMESIKEVLYNPKEFKTNKYTIF